MPGNMRHVHPPPWLPGEGTPTRLLPQPTEAAVVAEERTPAPPGWLAGEQHTSSPPPFAASAISEKPEWTPEFRWVAKSWAPGQWFQSSWDTLVTVAASGWSRSRPAERSQPTTSGGHEGRGRAPADFVDQLKRLKRDPEVRQAWEEHCRSYGRGIFDPSRHSVDYLQDFI